MATDHWAVLHIHRCHGTNVSQALKANGGKAVHGGEAESWDSSDYCSHGDTWRVQLGTSG